MLKFNPLKFYSQFVTSLERNTIYLFTLIELEIHLRLQQKLQPCHQVTVRILVVSVVVVALLLVPVLESPLKYIKVQLLETIFKKQLSHSGPFLSVALVMLKQAAAISPPTLITVQAVLVMHLVASLILLLL